MAGEINRRLKELSKDLDEKKLAKFAHQRFVIHTPEDTGNAKRNTKLNGNEIQTNYNYARVLDEGRSIRDGQMRGSTQAPKGMTKPTIDDLIKHIKDISKG
jgi:hypothetical protein